MKSIEARIEDIEQAQAVEERKLDGLIHYTFLVLSILLEPAQGARENLVP